MAFKWIFILLPEPSLQLVTSHFAASVSYLANFTGMKKLSCRKELPLLSLLPAQGVM